MSDSIGEAQTETDKFSSIRVPNDFYGETQTVPPMTIVNTNLSAIKGETTMDLK